MIKEKINTVSVWALIVNYNSAEECLRLYNDLKSFCNIDLNILVIDNASNPYDQNKLKKKLSKKSLVLNKRNKGYAGGNNKGIEIAQENNADYIWILNPDIRIKQDSLTILVKTMEDDKELAAIGPRILRREDEEVIFTDGELLYFDEKCTTVHKNFLRKDIEVSPDLDYNVEYIDGSCILLRAKAIKHLGLLPEQYFLYFEETHWCFAARRAGWKLAVNSNSKVFNLTSEKKEVFHYYFMRNRLLFCKEFHENFKLVRRFYGYSLYKEFLNRLLNKSFIKPYFKNRVMGYLSAFLRTL